MGPCRCRETPREASTAGRARIGVTVFFMHIPKTAGTTLRSFLELAIQRGGGRPAPSGGLQPSDEVPGQFAYPSYEQFLESGKKLGEEFDLICGHYPYHVRELLPSGSEVVSVVREPVERCLSHIKHQIEHERRTGQGCGVSDLNAFIELPVNRFFLASLRNLTVKYLSYPGPPTEAVDDSDLSLECALAHAEQAWLGPTDSLEALEQAIFERLLGCSGTCPKVPSVNRSKDTTSLDELEPKNRRCLRELNALDLHFYERLRDLEARGQARYQQ